MGVLIYQNDVLKAAQGLDADGLRRAIANFGGSDGQPCSTSACPAFDAVGTFDCAVQGI